MMLHLFVLIISLVNSLSNAESDPFTTCLSKANFNSDELQKIVYTPTSTNYTSILLQTLRNSRFNSSKTLKPTLILTPFEESQVGEIVKCAKESRVQLKTRSGGHDYEGLSYTSIAPFAILDTSNLRSIQINLTDQTAWVQTAATNGELYYRIWEKSKVLAFPAGVCNTLGLGGHISGGGFGNMQRKYGLASDNVVDAKIVDASGRILDRKAMAEDLFWAIRGGGGASFGVILSYKFKLVPVPPQVTVFQVFRRLEDNATDLLHRWQYVADKFDKELVVRALLELNNNNKVATFIAMYLGDSTKLVSIMDKEFPELGLRKEDCKEMSWIRSALFWIGMPDDTPETYLMERDPAGFDLVKVKSDFVKSPITKEGLRGLFKRIGNTKVMFNPYGGRMSEIAETETPFPHRAGNIFMVLYYTTWKEEGDAAEKKNLADAREIYDYMAQFVSKNPREAFLNYRDIDIGSTDNGAKAYEEGRVYGEKYFKGNFDRLVEVKTTVDPDNFFRNEQSIPTLKK